jgi:ribosomal protein S27E
MKHNIKSRLKKTSRLPLKTPEENEKVALVRMEKECPKCWSKMEIGTMAGDPSVRGNHQNDFKTICPECGNEVPVVSNVTMEVTCKMCGVVLSIDEYTKLASDKLDSENDCTICGRTIESLFQPTS